ncbi:MAG: alkaline phosphatase family protein [Chloroflexota bacterium]
MNAIFAYRSPLQHTPPAAGDTTGEAITRRLVFVLVDALREDTSLKGEVMPNLNALRQQGAWATMHSRPPSFSEPGYTTLLVGAWPDIHDGPSLNLEYEEIYPWTQDNLFSAVHRAGMRTAVSGYYWFEKLIPQEAVDIAFYTPGEDREADRKVVDAAIPWLRDGDFQLILIHLDQVDWAGHHEGGPRDPRWDAAASRADALIGEILAELDLERDTLFVCSDHGQIDRGGHGGQDAITLIEPFIIAGAGIRPGAYADVKMVDAAPTLAAILGANIPASSQGQVLTEMLDLSPEKIAEIEQATANQQEQLLSAYQEAIGQPAISVSSAGSVSTLAANYQATLEAAWTARMRGERVVRAAVALVVLVLLAVLIYRTWNRDSGWLVGGALIYLILFNLRYAVIDGRTYSLSSVYSTTEIVSYCAITALGAMLASWSAIVWRLKALRRGSMQVSELTLALVGYVALALSLPVLWSYVLNGAVAVWTLPDFGTVFQAFMALLQILLIVPIGFVLAGLGALAARLVK